MEVGGLSEQAAIDAWNDPELRRTTAVSVENSGGEIATEVSQADLARLAKSANMTMAAAAAKKSKTIRQTTVIRSWAGIECAGMTIDKKFLYDGNRVYSDIVTPKVWVNDWQGWSFDTYSYTNDQYGSIKGVLNRKHVSTRYGKFTDLGGTPSTISITITGNYDGTSSRSGKVI